MEHIEYKLIHRITTCHKGEERIWNLSKGQMEVITRLAYDTNRITAMKVIRHFVTDEYGNRPALSECKAIVDGLWKAKALGLGL